MKLSALPEALFSLILLIITALVISSCAGGGTSGTGLKVSGVVNDQAGTPLFGVSISTADGSVVTTTDENGQFELVSSAAEENLSIDVNSPEINEMATIEVGANVSEIELAIVVDTVNHNLDDVRVTKRSTPTPAPTRTPRQKWTPGTGEEDSPRAKPTRSPTPTPTIRIKPTTAGWTPTPTKPVVAPKPHFPRPTKTPTPTPTAL